MFKQIAKNYKESFTGLSRETWLLSVVILINRSTYMAVPFMSLYVTQYLHRSIADAGFIITLFGVGSVLGSAIGGKLTDKLGFRPVQIFTLAISGVFFIFYSTLIQFNTLCILAVVISFFAEAFRPANFLATAAYATPGTETRSYSLNRLASNIGWAVGGSLGGLLASISYPLLFVVDGAVSVVAAFAIWWMLPSAKAYRKEMKEKMKNIKVQSAWADKLFVKFILLTTLLTICFFLMFRVVPVFFKQIWHISEAMIGIILGLNGIIIALFEMVLINRIEKKKSQIYYIIIGALCMAGAYLLLTIPGIAFLPVALISISLFTVGEMFSMPFINSFVIARSNEFNRAQYATGYTLSWSVSQIIGPTCGFYLAEKCGYNWLWIVLILLLIISAIGFRLLEPRKKFEVGGLQ